MKQQPRLALALVATLLPLIAAGILLAADLDSPLDTLSQVGSRELPTDNDSRSVSDIGLWPAFRHDNGRTGFNSDVGVFRPPLAYLDTITLTDVTDEAKLLLNSVTGPERIYVMGQFQVWGIEKADPSVQWRYDYCLPDQITGDLCFISYMSYFDGKLILLQQNFFLSTFDLDFYLVVLDAATGAEEWRRDLGMSGPDIAMDGGDILVLTEVGPQGKLLKVDLDNNQAFYVNADRSEAPSGQAVVAGGRFVYANGDRILAYRTDNGQPAWVYNDVGRVDSRQYDLVATDDAVIAAQGERVIKINMADGSEAWNVSVKPLDCASTTQLNASATDGETVIVSSICDDDVAALDYDSGAEKWRHSIGIQLPSALAIGGGTIYVSSVTTPWFNIFAYDPDSGQELQKIEISAAETSSVLAISDGHMLTASNQGTKTIQRFERMPADVSVEMSLESSLACGATAGGTVVINFNVTNLGAGTTDSTRADLSLPDGTWFISSSQGACSSEPSPYCELGALEVGQDVQIEAIVELSTPGTFNTGIAVGGAVGDPNPDNNTTSQTVIVQPAVPADLDLQLTDIEITQGIQNLDNEVNLVRDKTTMVRLYGKTNGDPVANVSATLHGERLLTGEDLGFLTPITGNDCLALDGDTPDRDLLSESFVFQLPEEWLNGGVIFTGEINPSAAIPETNLGNNTLEITRGFTRLPRVCLKTYPVRSTGTPPGGSSEIDDLFPDDLAIASDVGNILSRALTMLPVRDIRVYPSSHQIEEWEPFTLEGWGPYEFTDEDDNRGDVLDTLWWINTFTNDPDICDADGSRTHYVGMIDQSTTNSVGSAGMGYRPGDEVTLFLNTGPNGPQAFDDPHGGFTLAHEIGHNYGRRHVDCGNPAGPGPYPDDRDECNIAPIDPRTYYGFEFRDPTNPTVITPTMAGDLMSYAPDVWTSEYTWEAIQNRICDEINCTFPQSNETREPEGGPPPLVGEVLLVRGQISPTITISQTYRLPVEQVPEADAMWADQVASRPITATYALNFMNEDTILYSEPFTPTQQETQELELLDYGLIIPWNPLTTRIVLSRTGSVVVSRTISASSPEITALSPDGGESFTDTLPISWEANDPDGDDLYYSVLYSADDGLTWQALAAGVQTTTLEVDISLLPGTDGQGLIKVFASDGLNYAVRQSSAGFSIPDRPPIPFIYYPDDGQEFESDGTIALSGGAYDPEDDYLEGDSLRWYVSGLGQVGTGVSAMVHNLDYGTYSASLAVTDSQSQVVTATVTFTITPPGGWVAPTSVTIDGPQEGLISVPMLFEATVSPITTTTPISYSWEATGQDTVQKIGGASDIQAFTWDDPGPKAITVTVSNAAGSTTASYQVTVFAPVIADFSASPTSGGAPLNVEFTNLSSGDYDTCLWEFGDGWTSSDCIDPEHTYTETGVFTVTLTVSGDGGSDSHTRSSFINVEDRYYVYVPMVRKPD